MNTSYSKNENQKTLKILYRPKGRNIPKEGEWTLNLQHVLFFFFGLFLYKVDHPDIGSISIFFLFNSFKHTDS